MSYPATCLLGHRLNAFRLNYRTAALFIDVGGVWTDAAQDVVVQSLSISDRLNEVPNTLIARIRGTKPIEGSIVRVMLGSRNATNPPLFIGNVLRVTRVWAANNPEFVVHDIEATDPTWRLNAVLLSWRYKNMSASDIGADLMLRFGPAGFTTQIEAGLPVLDEISFTNCTLMDAFVQLATRIGGYTLCDYNSRVFLFITDQTATTPAKLDALHSSLAHVSYVRDLTQIITRAVVEGGGGNALINVPAFSTILPVDVPGWYLPTGGFVRCGPQRLSYTGVTQGGAGAFVGAGTTPTTGPTAAPAGHAATPGIEPGTHQYAYTWVTASGETLPSPLAAVLMEGPRPPLAPGVTLALDPTAAGNLVAGAFYQYAFTFSTAAAFNDLDPTKESALSVGGGILTGPRPALTPGPSAATNTGVASYGYLQVGATYQYAYSFSTAALGSDLDPLKMSPLSVRTSYVAVNGPPGAEPGSSDDVDIRIQCPSNTGIPYKWVHVWRSQANGSALRFSGVDGIQFVPGAEVYMRDWMNDAWYADRPAAPVDTRSQVVIVTVPPPADPAARWIHLWRTTSGGAAFLWTGAPLPVVPGTPVVYRDAAADATLGAASPAQGQSVNQAAVSGISPGPGGVTARKIYRTAANAAQLKLLATIADNVTTALAALDTAPDATLGANVPAVDTAGLIQQSKIVAAGSTAIIVTSAAPFPVAGGYAIIGQQVIRYTGVTATTITGVPATGDGALLQSVSWGTPITVAPALLGISGQGFAIRSGDPVNIVVIVNDAAAQVALAALIGGDGVRESLLQDGRIGTTEAGARGRALLAAHKSVLETFAHTSRDMLTGSGKVIDVNLPAPTNIVGRFRLQDVTIATFNARGIVPPTFTARSSSQQFTFEDLLRRIADTTPPPATGEER